MATCKDCVHFDVCCSYLSTAYNKCKLATPDFKLLKNIECDECQHFKGRSRFVELPIKPGEKIYYFDTAGHIYKSTVNRLVYVATGFLIDSDVMFNSNLIGARFFLTREEAEQALKLKERENNAN